MNIENYSQDEIQRMIRSYEHKRAREKKHYNKVKDTEEFKQKNRERAKEWYNRNQNTRKNYYENNKQITIAKNSYNYYKKLDRVNDFKTKHPKKYQLLVDNHYLSEQNPDSSTTTSNASSSAEPSQ
jgi:hypothetical protein